MRKEGRKEKKANGEGTDVPFARVMIIHSLNS